MCSFAGSNKKCAFIKKRDLPPPTGTSQCYHHGKDKKIQSAVLRDSNCLICPNGDFTILISKCETHKFLFDINSYPMEQEQGFKSHLNCSTAKS